MQAIGGLSCNWTKKGKLIPEIQEGGLAAKSPVLGHLLKQPAPMVRGDQMSRNEQINYILQNLVGRSQDLEGALLVTSDGLPLASALPATTDEDRVAAMGAAALSMGARTVGELRRGDLEQVLVKGDAGYVVLIQAGQETVLAAISASDAKLGMILFEMKQAARDLARELG